ncbi:Fis family transcriptional regulator [Methylacidiphilum kamchatkense Kam1]|uniref:Fis family transcriptional regulator n=1 Tax=Methylacidiphilum kamchatkense Kam1 TaxID=1202785 RepID=A0A0C1RU41_9BACT|nr:DUF4388 domain-containing protein [Methylacidiphilum kamchatkense]KIE58506.1 Fis family transcriptional regulator [Methylacidiphilum kamchatkense Kam1]QDQ43323.1 hypothetical protein kam1_2115 [Methylacidiphilum kamchatkense Kam1]
MLFGKIKSIPLPQIVRMIGVKSGVLEIKSPENKLYRFRFSRRQFLGAEKQDIPIGDTFELKSILLELSQKEESFFIFKEIEQQEDNVSFSLPAVQLIIASLHALRAMYQKNLPIFFPDPETVFLSTGNDPSWIGSEFFSFWIEAEPFFSKGSSAKELAKNLPIELEDILFYIYTLRLLNMIKTASKKRTFYLPISDRSDLNSIENTHAILNIGPDSAATGSNPPPLPYESSTTAIQIYHSDQQDIKKGLLRRLIYGFKNFFRKMYE